MKNKTSDKNKQAIKTGDKLLNCPFCGGEARFFQMGITKGIRLGFIKCTECGLRLEQENCTEDFARNQWNTRKPMERILERLEVKAEKAMNNSEKAAELGQAYEKHMIFNGAKGNAFEEAIEIVKEEGLK